MEKNYTVAIRLENRDKTITIINTYAPPPATVNFSVVLEEIDETIKKAEGEILLTGDFNAHSTAWGYEDTDLRGRVLTDFLLLNTLFVQNPPDAPPSFLTERNKKTLRGWPDLTIASLNLGNDISDWHVSDDTSLSDHRYIKFTLRNYKNIDYQRHGLQTKKGKHAKFDKNIRKLSNKYVIELKNTATTELLDTITERLQSEITVIAQQSYKQKNTSSDDTPMVDRRDTSCKEQS